MVNENAGNDAVSLSEIHHTFTPTSPTPKNFDERKVFFRDDGRIFT
jgi:hypothetical protein